MKSSTRSARTAGLSLACLAAAAPATALADQTPRINWATYYGAQGLDDIDVLRGLATTADGDVVVAGTAGSPTMLASPGAHQTSNLGLNNAFLAYFDVSGQRLWGTYFGGSFEEYAAAVAVDRARGLIFLVGTSNSPEQLGTPGTHQPTRACDDESFCGEDDVFIAAFDLEGKLRWATYFGGTEVEDYVGGVAVDDAGHLYLCGLGRSAGLSTPDGHQPHPKPDQMNSFLASFDGDGALLWSTYYAGMLCNAVVVDDARDAVYIAGDLDISEPADLATPGAHQQTPGGGEDALVARFDRAGEHLWATYYGGAGHDFAHALAVDRKGGLYLAGATSSTDAIATAGAHEGEFTGEEYEAYLVKFDPEGARAWGTYVGGPAFVSVAALAPARPSGVYVAASADRPGLATDEAPRPEFAGENDALLLKFEDDGALRWSTYYGGSGSDGANAVAVADDGLVYLGGVAGSNEGVATSAAYQSDKAGPHAAFIAQFDDAIGRGCRISGPRPSGLSLALLGLLALRRRRHP